jgi:hypothetical protein
MPKHGHGVSSDGRLEAAGHRGGALVRKPARLLGARLYANAWTYRIESFPAIDSYSSKIDVDSQIRISCQFEFCNQATIEPRFGKSHQ